MLRLIAGLETPDAGSIRCGDEDWFDGARSIHVTPQQRRVAYLSQDYAIFPHLTVRRNVAYGSRGGRISHLLARFDLEALAERYPRPAFRRSITARGAGAGAGRAAPAASAG